MHRSAGVLYCKAGVMYGKAHLGSHACYPRIPQKRLQTQEDTPRKQSMEHVFLEALLGFGVSSGESLDAPFRLLQYAAPCPTARHGLLSAVVVASRGCAAMLHMVMNWAALLVQLYLSNTASFVLFVLFVVSRISIICFIIRLF